MEQIKMTKHAEKRLQQRCISNKTIEILEKYGQEAHDGHGCVKIFFDKYSNQKMDNSGIKLPHNQRNVYLVKRLDGAYLVTAAYRTKRIKRM